MRTKKASSKKRTTTRRPRAKRNPFAYQILASTPGNPYRSIGAFPASSQAQALKMAEEELKRKGKWTAGTKLIAGAVPLNSVAGRRQKNKTIIKAKKAVVIAPNPTLPKVSMPHLSKVKTTEQGIAIKKNLMRIYRQVEKSSKVLLQKYRQADAEISKSFPPTPAMKAKYRTAEARSSRALSLKGKIDVYLDKLDAHLRSLKRAPNPKRGARARKIREDFTGMRSTKTAVMNAPKGTPAALAKLGRLVSIKTRQRTIKPAVKNPAAAVWLCADEKGRLHLCTAADRLIEGPKQDFGEVIEVEYQTAKPHLGHKNPTIFFHKMGEEGGQRPRLVSDGQGGLRFVGGGYRLSPEGIID